jgi:hypothetical protein
MSIFPELEVLIAGLISMPNCSGLVWGKFDNDKAILDANPHEMNLS